MDLERQMIMAVAEEQIATAKFQAKKIVSKFTNLTETQKEKLELIFEDAIINRDMEAIAKFNGF